MSYHKNVFFNCPFDEGYRPLLQPLLFTIAYLGFQPRIALEELDSGAPRIQRIVGLIKISRYAIHDLSRLQAKATDEYYRLNMPLELGLDVGCRLFGRGQHRLKRCLILEEQRYRYQAALSDLSGSDIGAHGGDPELLVTEVRNWLNSHARGQAAGPALIWRAFLDFKSSNYDALKLRGFSDGDVERLPVYELIAGIDRWVKDAHGAGPESSKSDRNRRLRG